MHKVLFAPLLLVIISLLPTASIAAESDTSSFKTVPIWSTDLPPAWAIWERHLLDQIYPAAKELVDKYTRPDGTLVWRDVWPGMDGSDDGYESFCNFPLYYALGGHKDIQPLSEKLWDAVTRQFTNTARSITNSMLTTIGCITANRIHTSISSGYRTRRWQNIRIEQASSPPST